MTPSVREKWASSSFQHPRAIIGVVQKITWKCVCYICQWPIQGGKPTILFATDGPIMQGGLSFQVQLQPVQLQPFSSAPPYYLFEEQLSFLVQFFFRLYNLPGGQDLNRELRMCLADLLRDYPASMVNPMASFRKFLDEHKRFYREWLYEGDLETDFSAFSDTSRGRPERLQLEPELTSEPKSLPWQLLTSVPS